MGCSGAARTWARVSITPATAPATSSNKSKGSLRRIISDRTTAKMGCTSAKRPGPGACYPWPVYCVAQYSGRFEQLSDGANDALWLRRTQHPGRGTRRRSPGQRLSSSVPRARLPAGCRGRRCIPSGSAASSRSPILNFRIGHVGSTSVLWYAVYFIAARAASSSALV